MSNTADQPDSTSTRLPLRLFLLAHPNSTSAGLLATELMRRFVDPPGRGGLRLSVRLTPHPAIAPAAAPDQTQNGFAPNWKRDFATAVASAEHALVVILADDMMAQEVFDNTGTHWRNFIADAQQQLDAAAPAHKLLGVAAGNSAFRLFPGKNMVRVPSAPDAAPGTATFQTWLSEAADTIAIHIAIHAFSLLEPKAKASDRTDQRPFRLFLSHAKRDLAITGSTDERNDPVRQMQRYIHDLPIDDWFDARDIPGGTDFASEIQSGLRNSSVVIAFLTDHYSSRPWCLEEIVMTKSRQPRGPLVVVDALEQGESRSFPWLGNAPVVVWKPELSLAACRTILWFALREALAFQLRTRQLEHTAATLLPGQKVTVLPSSPEPADLTTLDPTTAAHGRILYPDPPIARSELQLLQALRPSDYCTPLGLLARKAAHLQGLKVAVSVSDSAELTHRGLCVLHEQDFTDEIHLSLLLARISIVYGGRLETPVDTAGRNFTLRLLDLVRGYGELAQNLETELPPILNMPPWPLALTCQAQNYKPSVLNLLNGVARIIPGPTPAAIEIPQNDSDGTPLFPGDKELFKLSETPLRRLAWTRGLSLMRQKSTLETQARIVMGGKLQKFSGLYPGVLEEAWWSIVLRQPLYLLGALGGAGQAVIDLLENRPRPDLQQALSPDSNAQTRDVLAKAADRGIFCGPFAPGTGAASLTGRLVTPLSMLQDLQQAGQQGPAAALNNGLTDHENRLLFDADEPQTAIQLIFTGLQRLQAPVLP